MNIVIAGGGVAGLSAAVVLRKLPFVKSIVILEKAVVSVFSSSKSNSGDVIKDETNHHRYNGLWSPALQCLQSMGIYSKIERHLEGVRSSGYKDVSGRWLAKPFIGLLAPPNDPSLAFIANTHLLEALTEAIVTTNNEESPVIIHNNCSVTDISSSSSKNQSSLIVKDSNNEEHKADLLIAADGTFSTVFSLLHPNSKNQPSYRGYKVYRGYSEKVKVEKEPPKSSLYDQGTTDNSNVSTERICSYGFQSWGPGRRFACIPTTKGNWWYITVSDIYAMENNIRFVDENKEQAPGTLYKEQALGALYNETPGPFQNGSKPVSTAGFQRLKEQFAGWHAPIDELIKHTVGNNWDAKSGVGVCDAYSFSITPTLNEQIVRKEFSPVAYMGDAAHTLDPILAQVLL